MSYDCDELSLYTKFFCNKLEYDYFNLFVIEPKVEQTGRKDDEDDVFGQRTSTSSVEGAPTSPPAKKPSKVMVPLPGFGGPVVSEILN